MCCGGGAGGINMKLKVSSLTLRHRSLLSRWFLDGLCILYWRYDSVWVLASFTIETGCISLFYKCFKWSAFVVMVFDLPCLLITKT